MVERFNNPWDDDNRMQLHNKGEYVRYPDYAALEAQLAVVRKALEEISEPETVWRRRAAEDGIRLAATDIAALTRERTPEVIARTALRKLGGRNVD